jgi:hypothetical protein
MVHRCAVAKGWWDKPRGIPKGTFDIKILEDRK